MEVSFTFLPTVLAVNWGVRDVALSRRNIRLFFGFSAFLLLLLLIASVVFNSVQPYGLQPARFLCPWDSLGRSTGVGCHVGLLGIFLTQGSNPGLLHCRKALYCWAIREAPFCFLAAAAKSLQSCSTLRNPIDSSPPGSPVPGIL